MKKLVLKKLSEIKRRDKVLRHAGLAIAAGSLAGCLAGLIVALFH